MGWFGKKQQPPTIIIPENTKCYRCGKKIKGQEFAYIEGKIYCAKCYQAKREWDFLEFHALIDD